MSQTRALGAVLAVWAILFLVAAAVATDAQTAPTLQDGVFTDAQANRGSEGVRGQRLLVPFTHFDVDHAEAQCPGAVAGLCRRNWSALLGDRGPGREECGKQRGDPQPG